LVADGRLHDWLLGALAGRRVVAARRLAGGYRNDNVLLTAADGVRVVLRRYRHGNRCAVEAALARRLAGVVPVAEVIAADPDGAVAGEPVLLSRFVPGVPASAALRDLGGPRGLGPAGPRGLGAAEPRGAAGPRGLGAAEPRGAAGPRGPGLAGPKGEEAMELGRVVGAGLASIGGVSFDRPGFFDGADLVPGPAGFEPTADLPAFVRRCLAATDGTAGGLGGPERAALLRLADHLAAFLPAVRGARQLVHADFNPKNLLVRRSAGRGWTLAAVLDWEFAYSSTPLADVGNMMRFADEYPPEFVTGFLAGFRAGGGELPERWREISRAVDLYALADLMTRPPEHPYAARVLDRIRRQLEAHAAAGADHDAG
jgi:fructokinase